MALCDCRAIDDGIIIRYKVDVVTVAAAKDEKQNYNKGSDQQSAQYNKVSYKMSNKSIGRGPSNPLLEVIASRVIVD